MLAQPLPATDPCAAQRTCVQLCGALVVEIDGRRVEALLPGRKGRQLFACLVISRDRPMSRDELIDVIWHTDSPADPDGTLSTLLTRLRTAVGHDLIHGRGQLVLELGANATVDWDVAHTSVSAAEQRLADGDARGALDVAMAGLEIARRPLLPGISTPWLEERRRELVDTCVALLETAGRAALRLGGEHLPLAERSARELIEREPYRESGYALLMESHAARGNIAEALRVYDELRRLLREELGLTPAAPVTALAERLLECDAVAPAPVACTPLPLPAALAAAAARPLAGRRSELRQLLTAVIEAPRCRVLAVTGELGAGKSRLVAEVAAESRSAGFAVLHGRAQRDGVMPLQPFVEALRGYLGHDAAVADELLPLLQPELAELSRVVPALRPSVGATPAGDAVHLQRFCDAATAVLHAASRCRPLLLVLDDLGWADRESLLLLRHITRTASEARIVILATVRDDEPERRELTEMLLDLHRERVLERLALTELDESETAELLDALGVNVDLAELRTLRAHAGGNPFYLEELILSDAANDALPPGLHAAVQSRLEPLPEGVRDALVACATSGDAFDVATVVRSTGAPRSVIAKSIAHAVRVGLVIRDSRERFAFRHGLVRHALVALAACE